MSATAPASGSVIAIYPNGQIVLNKGRARWEPTPDTPIYPKPATFNRGPNRHQRRAMAAKLAKAQDRDRKAKARAAAKLTKAPPIDTPTTP